VNEANATSGGGHLLEVRGVGKRFGTVVALQDVSAHVDAGEVTCILGDNGAGKSTLIKILAGLYRPDGGEYLVRGEKVDFHSPHDALEAGIATVYQDLALVPLMPIWRNFFLGSEPEAGPWPFRRLRRGFARRTAREQLARLGIEVEDTEQRVGTMSGGERQSIAISRAICGCAMGLGEITALISFLSMPASRTAPIQTSSRISQRVRSGMRRVGTSLTPMIAMPRLLILKS